jgi:hypothetical protein
MKKHLAALSIVALLLFPTRPTFADGCYVDPVHEYTWSGKIVSAVFMRDHACVSGTTILTTLSKGVSISVLGETDGWYFVESNGSRGWVGAQFVEITSKISEGITWNSYDDFMKENPAQKSSVSPAPVPSPADPALLSRVRGHILLDIQSHGEAWYVNPTDDRRYYLKDGDVAYQMMRSFGLGVTESDYLKIENGDKTMKTRLRGRIILRVQQHGEAYYIHPQTLSVHYLKDGSAAYQVMRLYSLGITSTDLARLTSKEVPVK